MLGDILKLRGDRKFIKLWLIIPCVLLSSCANDTYRPRNSSSYSSKSLIKDLRESNSARGLPAPYQDNDEEYVYPKFSAPRNNHHSAPVIPSDNDEDAGIPLKPAKPLGGGDSANPYMGDSDEDNSFGKYPKYNPDEDNDGYYYLPHAKPLPKPKLDETGKPTYPIYFD
jgi:hypothetical protein